MSRIDIPGELIDEALADLRAGGERSQRWRPTPTRTAPVLVISGGMVPDGLCQVECRDDGEPICLACDEPDGPYISVGFQAADGFGGLAIHRYAWALVGSADDPDSPRPEPGDRVLVLAVAGLTGAVGLVATADGYKNMGRPRVDFDRQISTDEGFGHGRESWAFINRWAILPPLISAEAADTPQPISRTLGSLSAADLGKWVDVTGQHWTGELYRIDLSRSTVGVHLAERKPGGVNINSAWFPPSTSCTVTNEEPTEPVEVRATPPSMQTFKLADVPPLMNGDRLTIDWSRTGGHVHHVKVTGRGPDGSYELEAAEGTEGELA